ncbi:EsaB/YukD family protein [Corynebacterium anserum]|uniref:Uncharacterized protein n=1 Tax=Corynebacterium anserum TaxID=2684406 RepID=A0A7G7YPY4_9CORY|nr:EsaB/YukD family protein [Corynebacterium anserum]MBC2682208.1 hypothetical protein [Corynebacterium anserum]QNH96554.1 hypothetical protein GP473_07690 [Corynebacterium anserum]
MLAVSISVPSTGTIINAAVADHVPVAELIPHLVEQETTIEPGQHWVLTRALTAIRPEQSLIDAGVRPGERLTLDLAHVPAPQPEAIEELSGPIRGNYGVWIMAGIAALLSWHSAPLFHPTTSHGAAAWGLPTGQVMSNPTVLISSVLTTLCGFACAAGSLYDKKYTYIAAIIGFGIGLNINVLGACVCAALLVWRAGIARIATVTLTVFAAINIHPGLTLIVALIALAYSGQLSVGIAGITLPKVPATGLFQETTSSRAGSIVTVHSTLVISFCAVILACFYQLIPWGTEPNGWLIALALAVAGCGASARGTRPIHASAMLITSALLILWISLHVPWGIAGLALVGLPAVRITSPMLGRLIDLLEALAFTVAIPLALYTTGIFTIIRGIG